MCGIFCELSYCSSNAKNEDILKRINNRGPDRAHKISIGVDENINLYFHGTVLWMQGSAPVIQPIENDTGVLLFNGDIFDETWDTHLLCDTEILFDKLSNTNSDTDVISVLHLLKGPFSIVYYDKVGKSIYFSRDRIGRTTLLCYSDEFSFMLASILDRQHKCIEVPATNLYKLNITSNKLTIYSWDSLDPIEQLDTKNWMQSVQEKQNKSDDEFSVMLDSKCYVNCEDEIIHYIQNVASEHTCKLTIMQTLLKNDVILDTVKTITRLLERSIEIRLKKQPQRCKTCIKDGVISCNHCTVGVLFSGGLDCTILAFLADKYVPRNQPIDLINVAFKMTDNASFDVPDRITGRQSLEELEEMCKSRQWFFRAINVTKEELKKCQEQTIADLVYPRYTILDESLGSALWFAAKGQDDTAASPCRVLLLGSGADELFGGYVRHRNAYKYHGWSGLSKELLLDWNRISFRNLARDNRVICDHGRQPRMPYLDEEFTEYVLKLKPWMKCFPSQELPCGIGDKLMLRLVALHLGLIKTVTLPKRALQFGSRIANNKNKGSDISRTFCM